MDVAKRGRRKVAMGDCISLPTKHWGELYAQDHPHATLSLPTLSLPTLSLPTLSLPTLSLPTLNGLIFNFYLLYIFSIDAI